MPACASSKAAPSLEPGRRILATTPASAMTFRPAEIEITDIAHWTSKDRPGAPAMRARLHARYPIEGSSNLVRAPIYCLTTSVKARSGEASTRRGAAHKDTRHGGATQGPRPACARMDLCSGETTMKTRKLGVYSIRLGMLLVALIVLAVWLRPSLLSASM